MTMPKAYEPEYGYKYQILILCPNYREYEHCDYATDKTEKRAILDNCRSNYGIGYSFNSILLPRKYWLAENEPQTNEPQTKKQTKGVVTMTKNLCTITEMKARNKAMGEFYFSRDTMKFFASKVETAPNANGYFVTSEQYVPFDGPAYPRKFTVKHFDYETGKVESASKFQAYPSLTIAIEAMGIFPKLV